MSNVNNLFSTSWPDYNLSQFRRTTLLCLRNHITVFEYKNNKAPDETEGLLIDWKILKC